MPKVGNKEFGYDKKGMAQARAASRKSGKPVKMGKQTSYTYGNAGQMGKTAGIQGQTHKC